jgi:hypothetical protein
MAQESRLDRLKNRNGIFAGILVVWSLARGIIDYVSSFDTIEGHVNQLLQIWHFIVSPAGNLVTFSAGLGWLGFLVFREPKSSADADTAETSTIPPIMRSPTGGGDRVQAEMEDILIDIANQWRESERCYSQLINAWNDEKKESFKRFQKVFEGHRDDPDKWLANPDNLKQFAEALGPVQERFVSRTAHPILSLRSHLLSIEHALGHFESYRKANEKNPPPNVRKD